MAGNFASASSQYLNNDAASVIDYPLSVGGWINLAAVGVVERTIFALCDTGTTNNWLRVFMNSSEQLRVGAAAGGTEASSASGASLVATAWQFFVARFINATNLRISVLHETGLVDAAQNTTSRAPTGLDNLSIGALKTSGGASSFWNGKIGEIWYTNTDIQEDAAALKSDTIRQLAYGGPFSIPHIAKDIIEYRSLRKYPNSDGDENNEIFHGAFGRQTWTNTNGVTTGDHPPLPYWYVKPGQVQAELVI